MKKIILLMTIMFVCLFSMPVFAGVVEEVTYLGLTVAQLVLSGILSIVAGFIIYYVILLAQKCGIDIDDKWETLIGSIIWRGVGLAEEEGIRYLEKYESKLDGKVKLKTAIDYAIKEIDKSKLPDAKKTKGKNEIEERIKIDLGLSRDTFKTKPEGKD